MTKLDKLKEQATHLASGELDDEEIIDCIQRMLRIGEDAIKEVEQRNPQWDACFEGFDRHGNPRFHP